MKNGFLSIVLHAHLPYVRHPEHESFFEENWLFEAITECYLPLLAMLERLQKDRVYYRLTLSLSPTLLTMLGDELLQARYIAHLHKLLELTHKEVHRTQKKPEYQKMARLYRRFFHNTLTQYQSRYQCNLIDAFKQHQDTGNLEIITCAATHGFLPLLNVNETAVRNQIKVGIDTFKSYFNAPPAGFWLPECGYYPSLETPLHDLGIRYFFTDTHSLTNASEVPQHGVYAPLACHNGVAAFARDPESSRQVWSSHEGYPGDFDYREYYRDIGFDLDMDYIAPYILEGHTRINTGIKYYRITGSQAAKEIYQPRVALAKAKQHAQDFINKRQQQINLLSANMDRPPLIVAPYDAELFGHWWFEGPFWLEHVIRLAANDSNGIKTLSCRDYLDAGYDLQTATPSASTWGDQGYSSYWINESNDWIWPFLHKASTQMEKFVSELQKLSVSPLQERALNQAVRSILLAQASDWPFIMKSGTTIEYANKRITDHLARFNFLYESVRSGKIDERYLTALEILDNVFPDINFRDYCSNKPH